MAEFADHLNSEPAAAKVGRLKAISANLNQSLDRVFEQLKKYEELKADVGSDAADVAALATHLGKTAATIKAGIAARPASEQATLTQFLGLLGYVKQ